MIRPRLSLLNPELQRPNALQSTPRKITQIWLDKNENLDQSLMEFSNHLLKSIPASTIATYPEAGELYRKLALWLNVTPESLLLTPGSDGAIRLVFEAFVEHGDTVLHSDPTFAMYPVYSQMFGAKAIRMEYQWGESRPYINVENIIELIQTKSPKILCLPNPDSPTGTVLDQQILVSLLKQCEKYGVLFLIDEAYHPFYQETVVPWTQNSRNLIVARTFAKAWGAAGMRIGYAVGHPETINLLHKMRPMYEVSTLATEFMTRMLDHCDVMLASVERTMGGKEYFARSMESFGFQVMNTEGNFLHVNFAQSGLVIHRALKDKVLYRQKFNNSCLKGYSRFSMAPQLMLEPVVDLIKKAMRE